MNETTVNDPGKRVTLYEFSKAVACHFTTASRLRSGDRMPGYGLLKKIVNSYGLDAKEALNMAGTENPAIFGKYLRDNVFHITDEELANDKMGSGSSSA